LSQKTDDEEKIEKIHRISQVISQSSFKNPRYFLYKGESFHLFPCKLLQRRVFTKEKLE